MSSFITKFDGEYSSLDTQYECHGVGMIIDNRGGDMKVLKKGHPQKGWARECVCSGKGSGDGGCGAKLLVEADNLYFTHHYDYGDGHDVFVTFRCDCCGVETDIDDVPWSVQQNLRDKKR